MSWPSKVFVATKQAGVFYTNDFRGPGAGQPTWTEVNDGLTTTNLSSFCPDRHDDNLLARQFCIDSDNYSLWRRVAGESWSEILDTAGARALVGYTVGGRMNSVVTDPVTGYVYVSFLYPDAVGSYASGENDPWVLRSVDHGDSWTAHQWANSNATRAFGGLDAANGVVMSVAGLQLVAGVYAGWSNDHWETHNLHHIRISGGTEPACVSPYDSARIWSKDTLSSSRLYCILLTDNSGQLAESGVEGPHSTGGMWFDPQDPAHMIVYTGGDRWYETYDGFYSLVDDSPSPSSPTRMYEIAYECVAGYYVVGSSYGGYGQYPVGVMTDMQNVEIKAGENNTTPPYEGSIPDTCGGAVSHGLWIVPPFSNPWRVYDCGEHGEIPAGQWGAYSCYEKPEHVAGQWDVHSVHERSN